MYSGRRYCVQRHIDNIHKGKANAIRFIEYLVGRRAGSYPPQRRPSYGSGKQSTIMEKTEDEVEKMFAQRTAESFLPPAGAAVYLPFMPEIINRFRNRQNASNWTEFFEMLEFLQKKNKSNVEATQGGTSKGAAQDDILNNNNILNNDVDLTHFKKKLENVSLSRRKRS